MVSVSKRVHDTDVAYGEQPQMPLPDYGLRNCELRTERITVIDPSNLFVIRSSVIRNFVMKLRGQERRLHFALSMFQ